MSIKTRPIGVYRRHNQPPQLPQDLNPGSSTPPIRQQHCLGQKRSGDLCRQICRNLLPDSSRKLPKGNHQSLLGQESVPYPGRSLEHLTDED